jgi:hypothetical protein
MRARDYFFSPSQESHAGMQACEGATKKTFKNLISFIVMHYIG